MFHVSGFVDANDQWTVNLIVGKIFTPISYIMGVPWEDCEKVGELVGLKTILNEFVAFEKMESMNLGVSFFKYKLYLQPKI